MLFRSELIPETEVAIELGGEDAKITFYGATIEQRMNGTCAGGTGDTLNTANYDEIITVSDDDAFEYGKMIGKNEGFLSGISFGAALKAAVEIAERPEAEGKNIVVQKAWQR